MKTTLYRVLDPETAAIFGEEPREVEYLGPSRTICVTTGWYAPGYSQVRDIATGKVTRTRNDLLRVAVTA